MDPFLVMAIICAIWATFSIAKLSFFTIINISRAVFNFNIFGMRILCSNNAKLNFDAIKSTCLSNKYLELLKTDKQTIDGDLTSRMQEEFENTLTSLSDPEQKEVTTLVQSSLEKTMETYKTLDAFCRQMSEYINVGLFTINEKNHARLSTYANSEASDWIILVDKKQEQPEENINVFSGLGILTSDTLLLSKVEETAESAARVFDNKTFLELMNKYKPRIEQHWGEYHPAINNRVSKGRFTSFLQKHSNVRRAVRNVKVLMKDQVTLSRTQSKKSTPKPKKRTSVQLTLMRTS